MEPASLSSFIHANDRDFTIRYKPAQSAREILKESGLPYLPIVGFDIPHREMLAEALKLESVAIPHRQYGEEHRGWKSLVLHGISSAHTQGAEQYGLDPDDLSIYKWTDIAALCPITSGFFKEVFRYEWYQRIRFMFLEPGGYVLPHQDTDKYFLGPTNIALNNPQGCRFFMENIGEVPFVPGQINKLALVNRHAVFNNSKETRVHIIVHGAPDHTHWNPLYRESYRRLTGESSSTRFLGL